MDFAKDLNNGELVAARDALASRVYACPRPECGGRVYRPHVRVQRPHFRHFPGEGTQACEDYYPSWSIQSEPELERTAVTAREEADEFGFVVDQVDTRWALYLRLPEIPSAQLGHTPLAALRSAFIEVFASDELLARASALDLRPGVGAARLGIPPTSQPYRTAPIGNWPSTISVAQWQTSARAMLAEGNLFDLRGGEWVRLREGSGVHWSEDLVVLADSHCLPPKQVEPELADRVSGADFQWSFWKVKLPEVPSREVAAWLSRLGHAVTPRPWSFRLVTTARCLSERREPVLWPQDTAVVEFEAPAHDVESTATLLADAKANHLNIKPTDERRAYAAITAQREGSIRLFVASARGPHVDLAVKERPPSPVLREALNQTPRLRVWIGPNCFEAWQNPSSTIRYSAEFLSNIRVDLGVDGARIHVTVWSHGRSRLFRQLSAGDVQLLLAAMLPTASRLVCDAENLGHVELHVLRPEAGQSLKQERLEWWNRAATMVREGNEASSPAFVDVPCCAGTLSAEKLSAAGLIRVRLWANRRRMGGLK